MAKTLEQRIDDLRDTLETGDTFSVVIDKLFALAAVDEFVEMGELKENEILEQVVTQVVQKMASVPHEVNMQLVFLEEFGLYHGSIFVDNTPGVLIYFESIQMGMLAIPKNVHGEVSYLRFTADIMAEGSFPGRFSSRQND